MQIWLKARDREQCAQRIADDNVASEVRERVRLLARGTASRSGRLGW
nr:hypothetical protein [Amnibacterium kyonggiense]